jgi:hypothetical protein
MAAAMMPGSSLSFRALMEEIAVRPPRFQSRFHRRRRENCNVARVEYG